MDFDTVSLEAAIAISGLSRRTLWRRIAEGVVRKVESQGGGLQRFL